MITISVTYLPVIIVSPIFYLYFFFTFSIRILRNNRMNVLNKFFLFRVPCHTIRINLCYILNLIVKYPVYNLIQLMCDNSFVAADKRAESITFSHISFQ